MATSHLAATLVQEVPADSGNFPWYMTDSTVVLEDSYSEVVVNVIDLALNWQLWKLCKRDVHEQYSQSCMGVSNLWNGLWNGLMEWTNGMEYQLTKLPKLTIVAVAKL